MQIKNTKKITDQYPIEYSNLLSDLHDEIGYKFGAQASPTVNKQETVSNLFKSIYNRTNHANLIFHLIKFPIKICVAVLRLSYISFLYRNINIPTNAVWLYSWLEPRSMESGKYRDEHFRDLAARLSETNTIVECPQINDYKILKKFINLDNRPILSDGLLRYRDVLILVIDYIFTGLVFCKKNYYYDNKNIKNKINYALFIDYINMQSFQAYKTKYIINNIIKKNPKLLVYVYENQSWEKVLCKALNKKNHRTIAIQGSGFSPYFLNFYPNKRDAKSDDYPTVILTVGEIFKKILVENSSYPCPIKQFSALRFDYPHSNGIYIIKEYNAIIYRKILYAFSVHISDYQYIINDLIKVFIKSNIEIHLKFHPQYDKSKFNKFTELPKNFKVIDNICIQSFSNTYDLTLFNDNSFGLESVILGVKSYQYNRSNIFLDERFPYFEEWDTHINFDKLDILKYKIQSGNLDKSFSSLNVSSYLNKMYTPFVGDISIFEKVMNQ